MAFALGDLAHNYIAENAENQAKTTDARLAAVLSVYHNAYLVGSDYPDTGYVPGFNFGEASHWPYFVDSFIDYIKTTYPAPTTEAEQEHRDRLIAFLLGVCTHIQSDIVSHHVYYQWVAQHDFGATDYKTWQKAHSAMDPASDYDVIVHKGITDHPVVWWIPVTDLVRVYQIMEAKNIIQETVTAQQIIEANAIYYVATGLPEDVIAYPAYAYDAIHYIPWGIAHFEDTDPSIGAFPEMSNQSARYIENVWQRIQNTQNTSNNPYDKKTKWHYLFRANTGKTLQSIQNAVQTGMLKINPRYDAFGDVIFTPNSIQFSSTTKKRMLHNFR